MSIIMPLVGNYDLHCGRHCKVRTIRARKQLRILRWLIVSGEEITCIYAANGENSFRGKSNRERNWIRNFVQIEIVPLRFDSISTICLLIVKPLIFMMFEATARPHDFDCTSDLSRWGSPKKERKWQSVAFIVHTQLDRPIRLLSVIHLMLHCYTRSVREPFSILSGKRKERIVNKILHFTMSFTGLVSSILGIYYVNLARIRF